MYSIIYWSKKFTPTIWDVMADICCWIITLTSTMNYGHWWCRIYFTIDYNVSKRKCSRIGLYALTKVAKNLSNVLFNNKLFNNTLLNVALSFLKKSGKFIFLSSPKTTTCSFGCSHRSWLVGSRLLGILGRGRFTYNLNFFYHWFCCFKL